MELNEAPRLEDHEPRVLPEGLREPSTLSFQLPFLKRTIIGAYWVVIILALPLWWHTTSIERLKLPGEDVLRSIESKLQITEGEIGLGTLQPPLDHRAAEYAPRYRLAFSLLYEDACATKIYGWDVESAIARHISPLLSSLDVLYNFTLESQVQFHAPLAFEPAVVESQPTEDGSQEVTRTRYLTEEDLTVFINSAEWTLSSSSSNDPVLHFLLFVPSPERGSLFIHPSPHQHKHTGSNSFLIPQWGGIVIHNPPLPSPSSSPSSSLPNLSKPFTAFAHHLRVLLGVPTVPEGITVSSSSSYSSPSTLLPHQLTSLLLLRIKQNILRTRQTLRSTLRLVAQIEGMPVGEEVRRDVVGALGALRELAELSSSSSTSTSSTTSSSSSSTTSTSSSSTTSTSTSTSPSSFPSNPNSDSNLSKALSLSAHALTLSQRAFFHHSALALLYFPAEHKYAVYTPLFASALIPVVVALGREVRAWRREGKERKERGE